MTLLRGQEGGNLLISRHFTAVLKTGRGRGGGEVGEEEEEEVMVEEEEKKKGQSLHLLTAHTHGKFFVLWGSCYWDFGVY